MSVDSEEATDFNEFLLDDIFAFEEWAALEGFDESILEGDDSSSAERNKEAGSPSPSISSSTTEDVMHVDNKKKRKATDNSKPLDSTAMKKRLYYRKKMEFNNKIKALKSIPQLICNATNAGDVDGIKEIVYKYFIDNVRYTTKVVESFGRDECIKNLMIFESSCPDHVIVYKDIRFEDGEVRWNFSFSATKQYTTPADHSFDPLTVPTASSRMVERASIIKSLGRKYIYFGTGSANMVPTRTMDQIQHFYISAHKCDVRFSETDDALDLSLPIAAKQENSE